MDILMCATPSLQQPALQAFQPLTDLVTAALRRCAMDPAMFELDPEATPDNPGASQLFILVWACLGESQRSVACRGSCVVISSYSFLVRPGAVLPG